MCVTILAQWFLLAGMVLISLLLSLEFLTTGRTTELFLVVNLILWFLLILLEKIQLWLLCRDFCEKGKLQICEKVE
nr:hydrophobic protein [Turkey adenovirus 3]WHU51780.1 hydrophobic protein [Turkey adenovirus 3]